MATFNWIITCGCNNPTEYHCNTCGENLCSTCKQKHLQNKDTKHHSVVEYTQKLTPGSLSSLLCHDHDGKECICWCQTCRKAACIDCVTKSHQDHRFTELETVLQEKRASLQKELNNLETNIVKEWQNLMIEARKKTSDFLGQVNGIEKEIEIQAKEFHKRVEVIKENFKAQLNEFKTSNLTILHEQEKMVSEGLEKVKQEIKECEDRLRSSNVESLLGHGFANGSKKDTLPKLFSAGSPVFIPSQIDIKSVTEMFGQLIVQNANRLVEGASQPPDDTSPNIQKSSKTSEAKKPNVQDTTHLMPARHGRPVRPTARYTQTRDTRLIPKPSVQSEFGTNISWPSVTCVGSGLAWVKTDTKTIQLMDRHGAVMNSINTDFVYQDNCLSPQGDILLSFQVNKCIMAISPDKKVRTLFKLQWEPYGLCCLHTGDIAVTFYWEGRLVIYSMSGKVIKEIAKKLFTYPYRVAQSKVNSDLYISDCGAAKVVALDKDYRVRYEYTGQHDRGSFTPVGLCTDNTGCILITDSDNHRVHILDRDGRFLQFLLTEEQGLWKPLSVDVDSEGNAWVGEDTYIKGGVTVVKYLQ